MPTFTFSSLPLSETPLEPHQATALLREWQHCNYEFVFAPHRYCTDLQKVVQDIYTTSHYIPFGDSKIDMELSELARKFLDLPDNPSPVIEQAFHNARGVLNYNRAAIKAVSAFGITIDKEIDLCKAYVHGRIVSNQQSKVFSHYSNISEDFFNVREPLVIPTMLIHPWYSLLLPFAKDENYKSIEQFVEPHPTVPNAILCTMEAYNIPCLIDKGWKSHRQRETWQLLQERFRHCSALRLPYSVEIQGDVAMTRDEFYELAYHHDNSLPQVSIKLTLPLISSDYAKEIELTYADIDALDKETDEICAYFGFVE
jgi:hypothetical protein